MNLPPYVRAILSKNFTAAQLAVIDAEWSNYTDIRFSSATEGQLIDTAMMVLRFASTVPEEEFTKEETKFLALVRKIGLVDAGKKMPGVYSERMAMAV